MQPDEKNIQRVLEASDHEERRAARVLTTAECARALGMSPQFIRGEIRDGRLKARVYQPAGRQRAKYRITSEDFAAYRQTHWKQTA